MFYVVTVATREHPMLDLLTKQVTESGETLTVLGMEYNKVIGWEAHGNLGLKLKLLCDFVNDEKRGPEDIVLFLDAYDVVYKGTKQAILQAYTTFEKPLVFGAETLCSPSGLEGKYPEHTKHYPFRYLNSGLFVGKIWAFRECFHKYEYVDTINDQLWWKQKFLERQDLIELDYTQKMFLNCCNVDKRSILLENDIIEFNGKHPYVLHFNGPSKAIMNRYAKLDPNPYFTLFPHVSKEYYFAHGGE